jgi:CHAD domain-containing protein
MEKAAQFRDSLPDDEAPDFEPLFRRWEKQRKSARKRMTAYLDSKGYSNFKRNFERFLHSDKEVPPHLKPKKGAVPDPHGDQVRHIAPSMLWEHYQEVRAYETILEGASIDTLHVLRIDCKFLRYALEFLKETLGHTAKPLISQITKAQDHLGDMHDADVAAGLLRDFLDSKAGRAEKRNAEPLSLDGIARYMEACEAEVKEKVDSFSELWEPMTGSEFRRQLGEAAAAL